MNTKDTSYLVDCRKRVVDGSHNAFGLLLCSVSVASRRRRWRRSVGRLMAYFIMHLGKLGSVVGSTRRIVGVDLKKVGQEDD